MRVLGWLLQCTYGCSGAVLMVVIHSYKTKKSIYLSMVVVVVDVMENRGGTGMVTAVCSRLWWCNSDGGISSLRDQEKYVNVTSAAQQKLSPTATGQERMTR